MRAARYCKQSFFNFFFERERTFRKNVQIRSSKNRYRKKGTRLIEKMNLRLEVVRVEEEALPIYFLFFYRLFWQGPPIGLARWRGNHDVSVPLHETSHELIIYIVYNIIIWDNHLSFPSSFSFAFAIFLFFLPTPMLPSTPTILTS